MASAHTHRGKLLAHPGCVAHAARSKGHPVQRHIKLMEGRVGASTARRAGCTTRALWIIALRRGPTGFYFCRSLCSSVDRHSTRIPEMTSVLTSSCCRRAAGYARELNVVPARGRARRYILRGRMTSQYYFACSYLLEVGSVVLPGNWGRILRMYTTSGFGNAWIQYREDVFEKVRRDEYPNKPSRLKSIFVCETEQGLRDFMQQTGRNIDLLYAVSLMEPEEPLHRGCLSLLQLQQQENVDTFTQKARLYWSPSSALSRPEIVTTSRVRIDGRI
jgi:hypothetical protein